MTESLHVGAMKLCSFEITNSEWLFVEHGNVDSRIDGVRKTDIS